MPAQPVAQLGALNDQVMAVIGEQLGLPCWPVQLGNRQIRMPQRGQSHRLGVDRVGLAALPPRAAPAISWGVLPAGLQTG
jgi:hypothetical protein